MSCRNPQIEAGKRRGESGAGISVNQYDIGLLLFENRAKTVQDRDCDVESGLPGLHDGEIVIGCYVKDR